MIEELDIAGRIVGSSRPTFVIAEIGMNHDGSLGMAHALIDACSDAGADCIKFQTRLAEAESTRDEVFRVPLTSQDPTRYDYWQRMQFTEAQWGELLTHARQRDLVFLSTAFSPQAVEMLARVGVPAWKVGSGELGYQDLHAAMASHGRPILLSTGMSSWQEIEVAVERIRKWSVPFGLFQCTSRYPLRFEEVGIELVERLSARFQCPSGLSDHSGSVFPGLAAMARGACMLEVHVAFDKRAFGPDVSSSITIDDLALICRARDAFHAMLANPVDKNAMADLLSPMRKLFSRSVAPSRDLKAGTMLQAGDLAAKRPGTGVPFDEAGALLGRRLKNDVPRDRLLKLEDLE